MVDEKTGMGEKQGMEMEETQADAYWAYTAKEKHRLMASLAKWEQKCKA